ncbi:MAG TPA: Wzz/FepE/Etk N-terminal domain-containing protein [Terriglobia bacterium]
MLGHRKFDLQDYLGVLRRRLVVIILPVFICPLLAYAATRVLVPRYLSTSLIFIDQPKVPSDVVKPMTTGDLIERVTAIQEQVLSRTHLEPLVTKYSLQPNGGSASEEGIDSLRKAIVIAPAEFTNGFASNSREPVPGLSISCTAASALIAQGICTDITSMFIEESLEQLEQLEQGTMGFISTQLADAKRKLDEEDAKLADFKTRNLGRLPDDQGTNLQVLLEHSTELEAASQALDRATQDRSYAQSLMQQQLNSSQLVVSGPVPSVDELEQQLAKKQTSLSEMEAQYTSKYPEVAKLKTEVEDLKKQIAERATAEKRAEEAPASKPPQDRPESPQVQQLRAQIHQDDEIIRTRTEEESRLKAQIAQYEQKLQLSPVVEEQLKNLTRDHETALHFYNDLLGKQSQSDMATALERREEGERFRLLDPANLPLKPDFPKRGLFLAGGLGGGIAAGLALALLLEMLDKSIRDERDIEVLLKIPNLGTLPEVRSLKGWKNDPPRIQRDEKFTVGSILTSKD